MCEEVELFQGAGPLSVGPVLGCRGRSLSPGRARRLGGRGRSWGARVVAAVVAVAAERDEVVRVVGAAVAGWVLVVDDGCLYTAVGAVVAGCLEGPCSLFALRPSVEAVLGAAAPASWQCGVWAAWCCADSWGCHLRLFLAGSFLNALPRTLRFLASLAVICPRWTWAQKNRCCRFETALGIPSVGRRCRA